MAEQLEPLDPASGKQMYLDHRRAELSDRTINSRHYRLKQFIGHLDAKEEAT